MPINEKKVFSLELADELGNVNNAYRVMRTFWNSFNQSKDEYEKEKSKGDSDNNPDDRHSSRSFRIQICIYERS